MRIDNKFLGKVANPAIPQPAKKEIPVTEELELKEPEHFTPYQEHIIVPHKKPRYNILYGSIGTDGGWRYAIDNYATGSFSAVPGVATITPVVLANKPNWKLEQWPGAVNLYLVIRRFSLASQQQFFEQAIEVSVPASAGPTTIFTGKGILNSIEVTTAGTTALTFQDGAGNILDTVPAAAPVGTIRQPNAAFNTSLVANNSATTGVVTVTYTPTGPFYGELGVLFQDVGGQTIPLGNIPIDGVTNQDIAIMIPTALTDPGNQNVGNISATLFGSSLGSIGYDWQMAFSAAYLIPAIKQYEEEYTHASRMVTHHIGSH